MIAQNPAQPRSSNFVFAPVRGRSRAKSFVFETQGDSCISMGMKNLTPTFHQISEIEFCAWLSKAAPGDVLEYHRGFLSLDRGAFTKNGQNSVLYLVAERAFDFSERGLVHLIQRKLEEGSFSYLAIKATSPTKRRSRR